MAGHDLTGHDLTEGHVAQLADLLPAHAVDELADGLAETYQQWLAPGLQPTAALGQPRQIATGFVRQAPGRRTALALLATGPLYAASSGPSPILGHAVTWPIPTPLPLVLGMIMLAVLTTLGLAVSSGHRNYQRTRLAVVGATGVILLDTTMLAATARRGRGRVGVSRWILRAAP